MPFSPRSRTLVLALALAAAPALPARAALPPLTDADWAAIAPASDPQAGALVLFKRAEFQLRDLGRQQVASLLRLDARVKVLAEHGLERGQLEIVHGAHLRLTTFKGRTLLPGGRVVPVPADAKFESKLSQSARTRVTAVAFPAVEVGAIVEYEAELHFDSILFLDPWYLSDRSPVAYAEVIFDVPPTLQATTWGVDPAQVGLQSERSQSVQGVRFRAWASNLPAVPAEPHAPPFEDLGTRYGLLTTAFSDSFELLRLFESWASTCKLIEEWDYGPARRRDREATARAKTLARGGSPRQQAEAVHRFVRDQVRTVRAPGVRLPAESHVDAVLAAASGDYAEKALLLQAMLAAVGVRSQLVWANERPTGVALMEVSSPAWFERVLVAAELPEGRVLLDAAEPGLPFGALPASVQGTTGLLFDPREPQPIELPPSRPEASKQRAVLDLAVSEDGALGGGGELLLTGHHAELAMAAAESADPVAHWEGWLRERFTDLRVEGVTVEPAPESGEVRVRWRLAARPEAVLGDELTLAPSGPLGPLAQPFGLTPEARRTPVLFLFPDRDEVELTVTYPAGWDVESMPPNTALANAAGSFAVSVSVEVEARRVVYRRELTIAVRESGDGQIYRQLRTLFAAAERNDARALALVRR